MGGGKYIDNDVRQVNHIDGDKKNNNRSNLELVTGAANVNHAHDLGLYTYNIKLKMTDIKTKEITYFRSLREFCRHFSVSLTFIKPRIVISKLYPIFGRFVLETDKEKYINYISTIKNDKKIYVYCHVENKRYVLTSYSQISILLGISYINIAKKLNKKPDAVIYTAGYSISLTKNKIIAKKINEESAMKNRVSVWKKLAINTVT